MPRTSCLNSERALHDRRLRRKMTGWEFRDFFFTLWFASAECRDPAFIPARKMEDLAMELGMTGKHGKLQFAQRLEKWSALDLIQAEEDGGLQINFVMDQEQDDDDDAPVYAPAYPLNGNGNGTNGNGHAPARQSRKSYSSNPDAERKREQRKNKKMQQDGYSTGGTFLQNVPENVPPAESKCPDFSSSMSQDVPLEMSQENGTLGRDMAGTSPARVSPNVNVSGVREYLNSSDSGDVYVQTRAMSQPMSHPQMSQDVPPPAAIPPSAASTVSLVWPGGRPALRPGFERVDLEMQQHKDLQAAQEITHDRQPVTLRYWRKLWKHCQENNSLSCWDMALEIMADDLKTRPEAVNKPGAWFQGTVHNLLRDNGVPMPTGTAAEREDVQAQVRASLITAEMQKEDQVAGTVTAPALDRAAKPAQSRKTVITPLSDIMPEMEDEE